MLQKPKPGDRMNVYETPFTDKEFTGLYPQLAAMLTATRYDDHSSRITSTLLIFSDAGVLRMVLNDRDNNRSAFFTNTTFESCLALIETKLALDQVEWKTKGSFNNANIKTPF